MGSMEYKIIETSGSIALFREKVNEAVGSGWKPQGGVAIYNGCYCQAMIKEDDE